MHRRAETPAAIDVRAAAPEDAEAIAQLLYENYHLSYVHADFYRPRYLMAALRSGRPRVDDAPHEGRVIGHHAVMPDPGEPSAETGAAVVHSAYRGLGVFGRMFEQTFHGQASGASPRSSATPSRSTLQPARGASQGYQQTALQSAWSRRDEDARPRRRRP